MTIDGEIYHKGALTLLGHKSGISEGLDLWHSTGGQIWVALVYAVFQTTDPIGVKRVHFVLWCLIMGVTYVLARRLSLSPGVAMSATMILSLSELLLKYVATLQYEILLTLGVLAVQYFSIGPALKKSGEVALGALVFLVAIIRGQFFFLAGSLMAFRAKHSLGTLLGLTAVLTAVYGVVMGRFVFFQDSGQLLTASLHSASQGSVYPLIFPQNNLLAGSEATGQSSGLMFILLHPLQYLELLLFRAGYLTGFLRDIWINDSFIAKVFAWISGSTPETLQKISVLMMALIINFGIGHIAGLETPSEMRKWKIIGFSFLPLALSFFLFNMTARYLMPYYPVLAIWTAMGLREIVGRANRNAALRNPPSFSLHS